MIDLHDEKTAPEASRPVLAAVAEANGFIPNMFRALSNAPSTLTGFAAMLDANDGGTLTPIERQIVQVVASIENRGAYCVAGHTAFTENHGLPRAPIDAIRQGRPPADRRHRALADFTRAVVRHRGHVSEANVLAFRAEGFSNQQILEVITGIALKTITNYVSTVFDLPLDGEFQDYAWQEGVQAKRAAPVGPFPIQCAPGEHGTHRHSGWGRHIRRDGTRAVESPSVSLHTRRTARS